MSIAISLPILFVFFCVEFSEVAGYWRSFDFWQRVASIVEGLCNPSSRRDGSDGFLLETKKTIRKVGSHIEYVTERNQTHMHTIFGHAIGMLAGASK